MVTPPVQLDMSAILQLYENQDSHGSVIFTYSPEHFGKNVSALG